MEQDQRDRDREPEEDRAVAVVEAEWAARVWARGESVYARAVVLKLTIEQEFPALRSAVQNAVQKW